MIDAKQLKELSDFPGYFASRDGDIYSTRRGDLKKLKAYADHLGYARVNVYKNAKRYNRKVARLVACAFIREDLHGVDVDHIDGCKLNDAVSNLRVLTRLENQRAFKSIRRGASSPYRGVDWFSQTRKWRAQIRVLGKQISIGFFSNEKDAARAYNKAAIKYNFLPEALNSL